MIKYFCFVKSKFYFYKKNKLNASNTNAETKKNTLYILIKTIST